ncbi:MAG: DUF1592 domain-containing protein [Gemmatimonadota bacterium]
MKTLVVTAGLAGVLIAIVGQTANSSLARTGVPVPKPVIAASSPFTHAVRTIRTPREMLTPAALTEVVQKYCQTCHNSKARAGNLSLEGFDVAAASDRGEAAEMMIHKLRAKMMPPPGQKRPGGDTLQQLAETLESVMDKSWAARPNPGIRSVQRLNRAEYERAIRQLLQVEVDAERWLPADQMSANFDNIADVQSLSPTLLDAYLNAATDISKLAIGDAKAQPTAATYSNSEFVSQGPRDHIAGAPYGTRGGIVSTHSFPADAKYVFQVTVVLGNGSRQEDIDFSVDGERLALLHYERGVPMKTDSVFVKAGQRRVSAAFVKRLEGPFEDLIRPHDWTQAGSGNSGAGTTSLPHLNDLIIAGPFDATGVSETASRREIFSCLPEAGKERACAQGIVKRLGSEAYRRPLTDRDLQGLMAFYDEAVKAGADFEGGVGATLRAILASPYFIFRAERAPENVKDGENYRLADLDLASRLSFFLWGTVPDQELLDVAAKGKLSNTKTLEKQARRMLADPRAEALATRFGAQWLRLQDLDKVNPDAFWFPNYDRNLAEAMRRETELFFYNVVRENRSVFELFNADYTFVNERLARHYGIPGVLGTSFQKVTYPDNTRRGIFGHGSVLVQTSLGNRTSPVLRGKWVMEVLLGTPPPPPPPGVPDLEQTSETKSGKIMTTRERMEEHRRNPTCRSCHLYMDPIGLALDNFDVTGKWRYRENGMPLDTRGELYDGTKITTPEELVNALLGLPAPLLRTFTGNLLAYSLGRRVEYYDQPVIRGIVKDAEKNNYRLNDLILGVVKSPSFRMKRAEDVADEAEARGTK